jgi:HEAT repeat protein
LSKPLDDLLTKLQDVRAEVKLEALESKQMKACFAHDYEEACPWSGREYDRLTEALLLLAGDPKPAIREQAARYLVGSTDARTVQPLGRLLRDPSANVRSVAAAAFWTIRVDDPVNVPKEVAAGIVQQLENLLDDTDSQIRRYAAGALVLNGTHGSVARLKKAYRSETDQNTKELLADVIRQLERGVLK